MKRAALAMLVIVAGYWEFRADLAYWLPAWDAVYGGQVIGQSMILWLLALMLAVAVIGLGYRFLGYLLD